MSLILHTFCIYCLLVYFYTGALSLSSVLTSWIKANLVSGVCESVARQLRKDGVGASIKYAAIVTPEEENLLLDKGMMGIYAPKPLVRAIFFLLGRLSA